MIQTMLAAVAREPYGVSPELWRCYLAIIVDGLASVRRTTTDGGIAPPPRR